MRCEESPDSIKAGVPGETPGFFVVMTKDRKCYRKEDFSACSAE